MIFLTVRQCEILFFCLSLSVVGCVGKGCILVVGIAGSGVVIIRVEGFPGRP